LTFGINNFDKIMRMIRLYFSIIINVNRQHSCAMPRFFHVLSVPSNSFGSFEFFQFFQILSDFCNSFRFF
jgi:hypothetical protein